MDELEGRDELLTWNDLLKLINGMTAEQRCQHVVSQNRMSGAFFGFCGVNFSEDCACRQIIGNSHVNDLPEGHPVLEDDDNWYRIKDGKVELSRYKFKD